MAAIVHSERTAPVGEIRVDITLTNAIDEGLARRGAIRKEDIRRCPVNAMVDTGAVLSVIPVQVAQQLGIEVRGQRVAEHADGRHEIVDVTEPIVFEMLGRDTLEEALIIGDEVLIGQTDLEKLDLLADCANRRLIPNPDHPDQPVSKVK